MTSPRRSHARVPALHAYATIAPVPSSLITFVAPSLAPGECNASGPSVLILLCCSARFALARASIAAAIDASNAASAPASAFASSAVHTRATPSAQQLTTSPSGSIAATDQTHPGCAMVLMHAPSLAVQSFIASSSLPVTTNRSPTAATAYTNAAWPTNARTVSPFARHRRAVQSCDAERNAPASPPTIAAGAEARPRTVSECPRNVATHETETVFFAPPDNSDALWSIRAQRLIVRSADADKNPPPSSAGRARSANTELSCAFSTTATALAAVGSQTRMDLSMAPLTTTPAGASGAHTAVTSSAWPRRSAIWDPSAGFHRTTRLSLEPDASAPVVGDRASAVTKDSWPTHTAACAKAAAEPMASRHTRTVPSREHVANASGASTTAAGARGGRGGEGG